MLDRSLSECAGLKAVRLVYADHRHSGSSCPKSFPNIHKHLPPAVTFVVTVISTASCTSAILRDFSTVPLAQQNMQYIFILSSFPIHDHLIPDEFVLWEDPYWSEIEDDSEDKDDDCHEDYRWMIRHLLKGTPPRLTEGPRVEYQCA